MVLDGFLTNLEIKSTFLDDIKAAQKDDKGMAQIWEKMKIGKAVCFSKDDQGILWFGNLLVVPRVKALRKKILKEAHESLLSIHPGVGIEVPDKAGLQKRRYRRSLRVTRTGSGTVFNYPLRLHCGSIYSPYPAITGPVYISYPLTYYIPRISGGNMVQMSMIP
jgi:hypothetical protein